MKKTFQECKDDNKFNQQIEDFKKQWVGKKVLMVGDHPHSNEIGVIIDLARTALGKYGLIVKSDSSEFFVFEKRHMIVMHR